MTTKSKTQTGILSLLENSHILLQEGRYGNAVLKLGADKGCVQFCSSQTREGSGGKTKRL
jgi:hypothetical protein